MSIPHKLIVLSLLLRSPESRQKCSERPVVMQYPEKVRRHKLFLCVVSILYSHLFLGHASAPVPLGIAATIIMRLFPSMHAT